MTATNPSNEPPAPLANPPPPAPRLERRLFHLCAASLFPITLLFAPRLPVLIAACVLTAIVLGGELLRFRLPRFNSWLMRTTHLLTKAKETKEPFASTYLLIATCLTIALFPEPLAILALFFAALGDPLAALVGQRWGTHRIATRTLEGSATFALAALAIGALLLSTGLAATYPVMLVGVAVAVLAELAPFPLDDNLKIPLASATVMLLMRSLL